MKRHADALTIEHIVKLRALLAEAERQRDNALNQCLNMLKEIRLLRAQLEKYGDYNHDDDKKY